MLKLPQDGEFSAFAMLVDMNGFGRIAQNEFPGIAQFTSDFLSSNVEIVEKYEGQVVGFAGDQFYALLDTARNVFLSCVGIAKNMSNMYDYFEDSGDVFPFTPNDIGIKIGVEFGRLDTGVIHSNFLNKQYIFTGQPVSYAARIMAGKKGNIIKGNKCVIGPNAMKEGLKEWMHEGPFTIKGKKGESAYTYYTLDLDDIWIN